jgi:hypothetical protein
VPTDKGAHAGLKTSSLVAGMTAGADSLEDMALLLHGAMGKILPGGYAPSTLGPFVRVFTFGHVRQVDAVASRSLRNLAQHAAVLGAATDAERVLLDLDDTIGYSRVRGLDALPATVSGETFAPVIAAQRLRKGNVGSPHAPDRH